MLPPGEGWALFLLWVCAHIGGFTANKVNLPPLLGMLIAGIILRNIPQGDPVELAAGCHREGSPRPQLCMSSTACRICCIADNHGHIPPTELRKNSSTEHLSKLDIPFIQLNHEVKQESTCRSH